MVCFQKQLPQNCCYVGINTKFSKYKCRSLNHPVLWRTFILYSIQGAGIPWEPDNLSFCLHRIYCQDKETSNSKAVCATLWRAAGSNRASPNRSWGRGRESFLEEVVTKCRFEGPVGISGSWGRAGKGVPGTEQPEHNPGAKETLAYWRSEKRLEWLKVEFLGEKW